MGLNKDNYESAKKYSVEVLGNLYAAEGGSTRDTMNSAVIEAAAAKFELNVTKRMYEEDPEG